MDKDLRSLQDRFDQWIKENNIDDMESCQTSHIVGDNRVVLRVIYFAALYDLPVPQWALSGFKAIYETVIGPNSTHRTWDEAFGAPYTGGRHMTSVRNRHKARQIWLEVEKQRSGGQAIDANLFELVGKMHGVGKTLCSELYYRHQRLLSKFEVIDSNGKWLESGNK